MGAENIKPDGNFSSIPNFEVSDAITWAKAGSVRISEVAIPDSIASQTFNVAVLDSTSISVPENLYSGFVDNTSLDGLSVSQAEENVTSLSYTPPAPPSLNYSIVFPDRPDISLDNIDLSSGSIDLSGMEVLSDIYTLLETNAIIFADDILSNISDTPTFEINNKIYRESENALSLRGIAQSPNRLVELARDQNNLTRNLSIIRSLTNNANPMVGLAGINKAKFNNHKDYQQAIFDVAKLNVSKALMNMEDQMMIFNIEIANAQTLYIEFANKTEHELSKLQSYKDEIDNYGQALAGNSDLLNAYQKQLKTIQQAFETFDQASKLSKMVIELSRKSIQVETENIKTQTMLVEGLVQQSNNEILSSKNYNKALSFQTDSELAKSKADLLKQIAEYKKELLEIEENSKNMSLNIENDIVEQMAQSVSIKASNIDMMFDVNANRLLDGAENQYYKSHFIADTSLLNDDIRADADISKSAGAAGAIRSAMNGATGSFQAFWCSAYLEQAAATVGSPATQLRLSHEIS